MKIDTWLLNIRQRHCYKLVACLFGLLVSVDVLADTFSDFFDTVSYNNQDGSHNWLGGWTETNDDGTPFAGDIRIIAGELRLQNARLEITRSVDLTVYVAATLSFDFREAGFDKNNDEVFVEIRSGGSGGWTQLDRFRGAGVGSGSASYSIPAANLAANTEIRFRTSNNLGSNDQFFVDNLIVDATSSGGPIIDHFDVNLISGTFGINCVPHQIRVTAHDSGHNPVTSYLGEIRLATTSGAGDWVDGGLGNNGLLANGAAGDGIATYQYAAADFGEADFDLDYTNGTTNILGIDVNDTMNVSIIDDNAQTLQFSPNGFTLTGNPLSNPPPSPINDPVSTQIAGTNFNVYLAAYGQTPGDSSCGIIEAYTGDHELHFWVTYDDPSTGTRTPTVDGKATLDQECVAPGFPSCNAGPNRQIVTFTNGQASVTVKYKDTGSINLNVKDDDFESTQSLTIRGGTGNFIVQPSEFNITTLESAAGLANPGTTTTGSGFVAAGEAFHVVVEVRDAEGSLVPNYGNETVPETVRIVLASLVYPAGGNPASFTNSNSFTPTATAGEFENNLVSWPEVGTLTMRAGIGDADYLGSGDVVGTVTGNVGRFYPGDFELVSATVVDSCVSGGFSYMSQPAISVNYVMAARSLSTNVVTNYDNTTLGFAVALPSYHAENNNDGTDLVTRLSIVSGQWSDGVLTFSDNTVRFDRAPNPDGPYSSLQLGLQINEPDGADFVSKDFKPTDSNSCVLDGDCDGVALGAPLDLRFGRMHLKDGFGPELAAIPMFWQTEYFDGSSFTKNTDDHCTQLAISDVSFTGATTVVDAAADTITVTLGGVSSVFGLGDPVGASDCLTPVDIGFCDGQAGIQYGPPGAVVTYPISVNLTNLPFLQFDWDQDGIYDDSTHPAVDIRFESYRGHDRVIYWQETLK